MFSRGACALHSFISHNVFVCYFSEWHMRNEKQKHQEKQHIDMYVHDILCGGDLNVVY